MQTTKVEAKALCVQTLQSHTGELSACSHKNSAATIRRQGCSQDVEVKAAQLWLQRVFVLDIGTEQRKKIKSVQRQNRR